MCVIKHYIFQKTEARAEKVFPFYHIDTALDTNLSRKQNFFLWHAHFYETVGTDSGFKILHAHKRQQKRSSTSFKSSGASLPIIPGIMHYYPVHLLNFCQVKNRKDDIG